MTQNYGMKVDINQGYKEGVLKGIIYNYTAGSMSYPDWISHLEQ